MNFDEVHDQATFVRYVTQLTAELANPAKVAEWENADLASFLQAMCAWATDTSEPANSNPWTHAAALLTAATVYE